MAWNASHNRTLSLIWSACSISVSSSSIFTTSSCLALMSKTRRSTKVNPLSFSLPLSHQTQLPALHPESQRNPLSSFCTLAGDVNEGSLQFEKTMELYIQWNTITVLLRCWQDLVTRTPMKPSVDLLDTLLNLSRVHGDQDICAEFRKHYSKDFQKKIYIIRVWQTFIEIHVFLDL